jgi:hypothetical protein
MTYLKLDCPDLGTVTSSRFLISNFALASIINIVFGMMFGIFFSGGESYRYLYGQWRYKDPTHKYHNRIYRVMLELVPALIAAILLYWLAPKHIMNIYLKFFVQGIGAWLTGFFLIFFTHNLFMRFDIIIYNSKEEGPIRDYFHYFSL